MANFGRDITEMSRSETRVRRRREAGEPAIRKAPDQRESGDGDGSQQGGKSTGGGLSKKDAAKLTKTTTRKASSAWHQARTDARVRRRKK
jgi:hypothetical protein